ncbi:MAG TPA: hypothetical protein VJW76_09425 [Verrucomicrobiae bacterium]|nr:hypothetical protein [Verrucomicrobiae bacterium]
MKAAVQPGKSSLRFYFLGLLVAGLEEFITQGVLKRTLTGWIIPTLIAFIPFLVLVRMIGWWVARSLSEAGAVLIYFLAAGAIGLLVEWFLIGLSPWRDPQAPILPLLIVHLGMFSFWASVALVPRWLQDDRPEISKLRGSGRRFLICSLVVIYTLTFVVPKEVQFPVSIGAVLLAFLSLNVFHFGYICKLKSQSGNPNRN